MSTYLITYKSPFEGMENCKWILEAENERRAREKFVDFGIADFKAIISVEAL